MTNQVNNDKMDNGVGTNNATKKPNFVVTTIRKVRKAAAKLSQDHPILYKAGKALSLVGSGYGIYKLGFKKGAKSVVPTTVYIQSGVEEDEPEDIEEETAVEETNEEPAVDELSEV